MKRLIPLWITALGGFALIVAYFIPHYQSWGERAAIWFDILAAIAFILGGGNLLKIHLKKVSDQATGWGYSVITVVSFLVMLYVGLVKWGSPPAPIQEHYGETWVSLPLASLPVTVSVPGSIPVRADGERIHESARAQISEEGGQLTFRGWMRRDQRSKLLEHVDQLDWKCSVETLYERSQPTGVLKRGRTPLVAYYADHSTLSFLGHMTEEHRDALKALSPDDEDPAWTQAIDALFENAQETITVAVDAKAPLLDPQSPPHDVSFENLTLSVTGPMTAGQRAALWGMFPIARPLTDGERAALVDQIRTLGPLHETQEAELVKILATGWTVNELRDALNVAGEAEVVPRSACEMLADREAGIADIPTSRTVGEDQVLNQAQGALLLAYSRDPSMTIDELNAQLQEAGDFKEAQQRKLYAFLEGNPTVGQRRKDLCFGLMKVKDVAGNRFSLTEDQRTFLLADYRAEVGWRRQVGEMFIASHTNKFPMSGEYRAQGNPFWWLYEYAFKPLQATTFAMLAFYVASAAFRAFRAKNVEAILLLSTAFIILLGRTFAGVFLTAWMPEALSGLKIENLTVYIMSVFNTAGNRAIMIGIALGIASTSLKVLLGVDRSYLGSGE